MPVDDQWDWPVLLYVGTVLLNRTELQFWRMTPRKLNALTNVHVKFNGGGSGGDKQSQQTGYIDNVF